MYFEISVVWVNFDFELSGSLLCIYSLFYIALFRFARFALGCNSIAWSGVPLAIQIAIDCFDKIYKFR